MENSKKGRKRQVESAEVDSEDESLSSGTNSDSDMELDEQQINIEFEAQTPVDTDFHGIKQLMMRVFQTLHVDLSELTDLIISQNSVGSTIKIVDDEDDEIYGITSVISMKKYQEKKCIKELCKGLLNKCKAAESEASAKLEKLFEEKNIGFIVNERFINIPPQIAGPFHRSLNNECENASDEDSTFNFDYLLLLSKTLRPNNTITPTDTSIPPRCDSGKNKAKKKKKSDKALYMGADEVEYTNFEDEIFHKASEMSFSYSVTEATGLAIGGSWDFGDQPMNTYRTVMLVPATKWRNILSDIEDLLAG